MVRIYFDISPVDRSGHRRPHLYVRAEYLRRFASEARDGRSKRSSVLEK